MAMLQSGLDAQDWSHGKFASYNEKCQYLNGSISSKNVRGHWTLSTAMLITLQAMTLSRIVSHNLFATANDHQPLISVRLHDSGKSSAKILRAIEMQTGQQSNAPTDLSCDCDRCIRSDQQSYQDGRRVPDDHSLMAVDDCASASPTYCYGTLQCT